MAGTNNFLPFCPTDTGTNLLPQNEYAVASDRDVGNQPGVAKSRLVNKALRQSAFVTSQVAQYLANKLDENVVDNANTAAFQAQLVSALAPNNNAALENIIIEAAVGSNELVIDLKTRLGEDFSATDIGFASFRSATLASGFYNRRSIINPLSLTISSGSTLGQTSGQAANVYVYLIDNAGDVELAVSGTQYPEDGVYTTVAEGGSGGADSATVIYSQTARTDVPIRLVGYLLNTQATAGTWATNPSKIQLTPFDSPNPVPTGSVLTFAGSVSPVGFLLCNGDAVSRSTYSALFSVLGESHGQGDGSTTFNLPDYRGRFLRGVTGGSANDPDAAGRTAMATGGNTGNNVGSVQGHAFQTHKHEGLFAGTPPPPFSEIFCINFTGHSGNRLNTATSGTGGKFEVGSQAATGATSQASANETRPVNAYVNYIIKT